MATFLVLIYGDERKWAAMSSEEMAEFVAGHRDLAAAAGSAVLATGELEPDNLATTLRADAAGRRTTTTGPYVESTESIGGYYLIEARDADEVVGWAARLYEASANHGGVEIRRVQDPS